jgi:hypothetical protein
MREEAGNGGCALCELVLDGLAKGRDEDEDEDERNGGEDDLLDATSVVSWREFEVVERADARGRRRARSFVSEYARFG